MRAIGLFAKWITYNMRTIPFFRHCWRNLINFYNPYWFAILLFCFDCFEKSLTNIRQVTLPSQPWRHQMILDIHSQLLFIKIWYSIGANYHIFKKSIWIWYLYNLFMEFFLAKKIFYRYQIVFCCRESYQSHYSVNWPEYMTIWIDPDQMMYTILPPGQHPHNRVWYEIYSNRPLSFVKNADK